MEKFKVQIIANLKTTILQLFLWYNNYLFRKNYNNRATVKFKFYFANRYERIYSCDAKKTSK